MVVYYKRSRRVKRHHRRQQSTVDEWAYQSSLDSRPPNVRHGNMEIELLSVIYYIVTTLSSYPLVEVKKILFILLHIIIKII